MIGIYKITNLINGKAYVGQSNHIQKRWNDHITTKKQTPIHQAIVKYGKENFSFEVLEECKQSELNEREQYWIAFYDTYENGYNLTLGGDGTQIYDYEAIYQDFLITKNMAHTAINQGCATGTVRRVLRTYDINLSECSENKPVEQIDPNTLEVIAIYPSIAAAARSQGITAAVISNVVNGKKISANNYYWRFEGDTQKQFQPITKQWKRKVAQIDIDTQEVLHTYSSASEAARACGKDGKNGGSQILTVCKGKKKTAFGYQWKYI